MASILHSHLHITPQPITQNLRFDQGESDTQIEHDRHLSNREACVDSMNAAWGNSSNDDEHQYAQIEFASIEIESSRLSTKLEPFGRNIGSIKIIGEKERSARRRGLSMNAAYWTLDAGHVKVLAALSAVPLIYSMKLHWVFTAWLLVSTTGLIRRTPLLSRSIHQCSRSALGSFVVSATCSAVVPVFSTRLLLLLSALSALVIIFMFQNYDYYILGRKSPKAPGLSHWQVDMHRQDADCRYLDVKKQYLDLAQWQEDGYRPLNTDCQDRDAQNIHTATRVSAERAQRLFNIAESLYRGSEQQGAENARKYWVFGPGKLLRFLDSFDSTVEDLAYECNLLLSHLKAQAERLGISPSSWASDGTERQRLLRKKHIPRAMFAGRCS